MNIKLVIYSIVGATILCVGSPNALRAEDLAQIFGKVSELVTANNYPKALQELSWAQKEIERMHAEKMKGFLPDSLAGYTGDEVEGGNAFGISQLERTYRKGNETVKVSVVGGTGGAQSGFGGFAALGQMAAMMGNQPGMDSFRIDGRTAMLQKQGSSAELTVILESGSMLKLENSSSKDSEILKKMAGELKVATLDAYLKG